MQYWWVNQNQTHEYEITGGFMWSPKKNKNGARNTYYDNMTKVKPGDIVFSFFNQKISYLGVIKSPGYDHEKPEFLENGAAWNSEGWMVNVAYRKVRNPIFPKEHIEHIRDLLPTKYSPLQRQTGKGLQGVYLASTPEKFAKELLILLGEEAGSILAESGEYRFANVTPENLEGEILENIIRASQELSVTEKETLIRARVGQGKFRENVIEEYGFCPLTRISDPKLLKASHIKPWAKCKDHSERLDTQNGIPFSPAADHLFDNGFITFDDKGYLLFSSQLKDSDYEAMGLKASIGSRIELKSKKQGEYLKYHRDKIFKK